VRLRAHGPNLLVPNRPRRSPALVWAWHAVSDSMAVLLLASTIYVSLGDVPDSIVTLAARVSITAVSLQLEVHAERALAGLRRLLWREPVKMLRPREPCGRRCRRGIAGPTGRAGPRGAPAAPPRHRRPQDPGG
jgi:hypothetical protein